MCGEGEWDGTYPLVKIIVRCGVRTHALSRVPELKSGALDHSANLTCEASIVQQIYINNHGDFSLYSLQWSKLYHAVLHPSDVAVLPAKKMWKFHPPPLSSLCQETHIDIAGSWIPEFPWIIVFSLSDTEYNFFDLLRSVLIIASFLDFEYNYMNLRYTLKDKYVPTAFKLIGRQLLHEFKN